MKDYLCDRCGVNECDFMSVCDKCKSELKLVSNEGKSISELKVTVHFDYEAFKSEAVGRMAEFEQYLDDKDYMNALKEIASKHIKIK